MYSRTFEHIIYPKGVFCQCKYPKMGIICGYLPIQYIYAIFPTSKCPAQKARTFLLKSDKNPYKIIQNQIYVRYKSPKNSYRTARK